MEKTKLVKPYEVAHLLKDRSKCKQLYWPLKSVLAPSYLISQAERLGRKHLSVFSRKDTVQFTLLSTNMYWVSNICHLSACSLGPQHEQNRVPTLLKLTFQTQTLMVYEWPLFLTIYSPHKKKKIRFLYVHVTKWEITPLVIAKCEGNGSWSFFPRCYSNTWANTLIHYCDTDKAGWGSVQFPARWLYLNCFCSFSRQHSRMEESILLL